MRTFYNPLNPKEPKKLDRADIVQEDPLGQLENGK